MSTTKSPNANRMRPLMVVTDVMIHRLCLLGMRKRRPKNGLPVESDDLARAGAPYPAPAPVKRPNRLCQCLLPAVGLAEKRFPSVCLWLIQTKLTLFQNAPWKVFSKDLYRMSRIRLAWGLLRGNRLIGIALKPLQGRASLHCLPQQRFLQNPGIYNAWQCAHWMPQWSYSLAME